MFKRTLLLTLALSLLLSAILTTTTPAPAGEGQWLNTDIVIARVAFDDPETTRAITAEMDVWEFRPERGYLVVSVSPDDYEWLVAQGFDVVIDEAQSKGVQRFVDHLDNTTTGIPGYACYRTVEETYSDAADLATDYPHLAEWLKAGESWEKITPGGEPGYDIMVLRLSRMDTPVHPDDKPKLYTTSAIHAREYTTAELSLRFAEWLVENYDSDPEATWLLDHHDIHLMLHANPDGRKKAETGLSWRKNTNQNYCGATSNSRGADLNRNFPFQWGCCGGSSGNACAITYRGPSPASEPETQAVINWARAIFPDQREDDPTAAAPVDATGVYIDIHSYSELVIWPWGYTSTVAPNGTALQTLGRKLAWFSGYEPYQAIGLYPSDGTTDDFFYGDLGVAAYTYELGTSFFEPCSNFENRILPDNLESLIYAAKVVRTPYMTPAGPDALEPTVSPGVTVAGSAVQLTATIDDTRFENRHGAEPVQNVVSAEFYLNTPPWDGGTPLPMTAADGAFNAPVELAEATLDTTGLPVGRHTLFVRGTDADGNQGAFSAVFLHIIDPAVAPIVAGYVSQETSMVPLTATVSAGSLTSVTSSPTGFFSLQLPPGSHTLTASAENHLPQTVTLDLVEGENLSHDFVLTPFCAAWEDDVENGNIGWTAQSPWAITEIRSASPTHSWTDSPTGNYGHNLNVSLTSPVIDLTGYTGVQLQFASYCNSEGNYDFCRAEISTNGGGSWSQVWSTSGLDNSWRQIEVDVPQLDNQANVRVRFRFTSDSHVTAEGWYVDDIALRGSGPECIATAPTAVQMGAAQAGSAEIPAANPLWLALALALPATLALWLATRRRPGGSA